MAAGYYRFPTIHGDTVVFVSEDDLWSVPATGGVARRLTSNRGEVTYPMLSPDGTQLAFVGREEGAPEVYRMPAQGGTARRLTYNSSDCRVVGWDQTGTHILFTTNFGQDIAREYGLFRVSAQVTNGAVEALPFGPARSIAFGPAGQVVLGRNTGEPARWKRYRGGTAGHLWIDANGDGEFQRLLPELEGNIATPMWIADGQSDSGRIYLVSDHEGIGNLYSCLPDGSDLVRHSDHEDYYARNPSTDGRRIVYHSGADLYLFDVASGRLQPIEVEYHSPRVQRTRRFVSPGRYLDSAGLAPKGKSIALTTRGKAFSFSNHEGAVLQHGQRDGVRYRLTEWLNDGKRLVMVSDAPGEEVLEIHSTEPGVPPRPLATTEFGRAVELKVSPTADRVALSNHRHELLLIDLESGETTVVDRSPYRRTAGYDWSPDGRWLVYGYPNTLQTTELRLFCLPDPEAEDETLRQGSIHTISQPVLHDVRPVFDPTGHYIYFLSYREFNPVYDSLHFDLGFPRGMRPYLITLQKDLPNPFVPRPDEADDREDEEEEEAEEDGRDEEGSEDAPDDDEEGGEYDEHGDEDDSETGSLWPSRAWPASALHAGQTGGGPEQAEEPSARPHKSTSENAATEKDKSNKKPQAVHIDLEGIEHRVLAFPVPEGRYGQVAGIPHKAIFTQFSIQGSLDDGLEEDEEKEEEGGLLRAYDFKEYRSETLADGVNWFELSRNGKKLLYSTGSGLRVIPAGEKAPSSSGSQRKSGWIDLGRVKVSVEPQSEWEQMFREAWRLQRDQFWTEDMSQVDWQTVYERYFCLIERVSSRGEFSDLMWEMQGELGTSHAYEIGGDYRPRPVYGQGFLATELRWDEETGGYRLGDLIQGDSWDDTADSPLATPGVDVRPGDAIVAVNGQPVSRDVSPAQLLVNQAGEEVMLAIRPQRPETANHSPEPDSKVGRQSGTAQQADALAAALRTVTVRALSSEAPVRYRAWVERNRRRVHEASGGQVGYVHIPDMGPRGYAEFHRGFLAEVAKDALIVDVRYNGGGHVSQLILEKLARRRLGYDLTRWGGATPYPAESVAGPMVALTNEHAGSDGDIFCHSFKLMNLGPLVGKRTWGGVVGIWPRHALVDGTVTTQPEFSFWFEDVGWKLENYGTDPDVEVDNTPQDYRGGRDSQLEQAIQEVMHLLEANPPRRPDWSQRPSRALPKLPPRR